MYDFRDEYKMNFFLKQHAKAFVENPNAGTMTNLLAEFVIRIEDECEALVPMVMEENRIHYDTISDGQNEWIPMYTDWDELTKEQPTEYTMSVPIRTIVKDAFESKRAEGIILNLHSEEVFIGKAELDWVLDVLMQRESDKASQEMNNGRIE